MSVYIEVFCPKCKTKFDIDYILLKAPSTCPSCKKTIIPEVIKGAEYPNTEYEIAFGDFHQLLSYKGYRRVISKLFKQWFDYKIIGVGELMVVQSHNGDEVNLLDLHLRIQKDSTKQLKLYRTAMGLWR